METRSSQSMSELRTIAAERGLKYYLHLSKPELHALLQRKEGGATANSSACNGTNASATTTATATVNEKGDAAAMITKEKETTLRDCEETSDGPTQACAVPVKVTMQRCSERLSALKRKAADDDAEIKTMERKKARKPINIVDPIMFTELGPHTFEFVRHNGSVVVYNVESLVQYILATGDFSEPESRIPFSEDDLRRIDAEAKRSKLNERSVLDAKRNKHEFEEQKVKRDGLLGLERCAGEVVTQMLEVVECDDPEEGELQLIMSLFPSFSSFYEQIRSNDADYASQCLNHFKAYLRGPKNRPTTDRSGLLAVILSFLDDVGTGNQDASSFGF